MHTRQKRKINDHAENTQTRKKAKMHSFFNAKDSHTQPAKQNLPSHLTNEMLLIKPDEPLQIKLRTALEYVLRTVVLGASNKIADIKKSNEKVMHHRVRYEYPGQYYKCSPLHAIAATDLLINGPLYPHTQWYYHFEIGDDEGAISLSRRNPEICPLTDPQFILDDKLRDLLISTMATLESRQANCERQACLLAKYLWENNAGIDSIEVISTKTFDHTFVVVNRRGKLHDPTTWGNAWIIDSWYGDKGLIFHASDFTNQINKIKKFAAYQVKKLNEMGIPAQTVTRDNETLDACLFTIKPARDRYPTYSVANPSTSVFHPIEYYYEVCNSYPSELHEKDNHGLPMRHDISPVYNAFALHKQAFKKCLNEIDSPHPAKRFVRT